MSSLNVKSFMSFVAESGRDRFSRIYHFSSCKGYYSVIFIVYWCHHLILIRLETYTPIVIISKIFPEMKMKSFFKVFLVFVFVYINKNLKIISMNSIAFAPHTTGIFYNQFTLLNEILIVLSNIIKIVAEIMLICWKLAEVYCPFEDLKILDVTN